MAVKARAEITLSSIRDVQNVTRYYLLQSSTSAVPSKPTTNPPGGNWVTAEPTYTSGSTNSLYFVDLTGFSDGTFAYSDVSLSSSYEAAKVAYNKAVSAEGVANSASDKVDNLEVGGRNLVRRTDYSIYGNSNNYINANQAIFSSDRITIPFGKDVWQKPSARNKLKTPIPKGTKIIMSVYVYEQTVPDGNHRLYVCGLKSDGSVNWSHHYKAIPYDFVGKFTWEHTTPEDFYGFILEFDTRSGTSGQMVLGPVKAEIGTLATDWTPAPEDVDADISASQATADSKNTVYYQASAPSGGTYKVNDIWFDTDNGNKMYMWNGNAWTAETFGTAAISDLAITNAKIANGTIQNAKIANLDAGKITTGTMSANRIKGDTLTLGGANDVDGMLKVYDANGTLVGSFTREGLMAIAGTIGGWIINSSELTGEWQETYKHFESLLSPVLGLQFEETSTEPGFDAQFLNSIWYGTAGISFLRRRTVNNAVEQLSAFISADTNGGWDGSGSEGQITISPHLRVDGTGIDTPHMRADASYAWDAASGSYIRQPAMIMAGSTTIWTGTSSKRATICAIPVEYQTGWRIIPFVTRTYGNPGATPADTGDFYYAYYNSVDHNVCIKLANVLTSGIPYVFDYMIYAVPTT